MITIDWTPTEEEIADARLVTAARNMYETLQAVDATLDGVDSRLADHIRRVIAPAIAKAKGAP